MSIEGKQGYCVVHGERHNGGMVLSVHATLRGAIRAALKVKPHFTGGWVLEDPDEDLHYWINGCDFVMVREYTIKE